MTFTTMYSKITTDSGRSDKSTLAKECINDILRWITSQNNFKWMEQTATFPTVASTATYTITTVNSNAMSDYKSFITLTQTSTAPYTKLTWKPPDFFDKDFPYPAGDPEGNPKYFTEFEGKFYLHPIPDAVYTISVKYYGYHAALSGDSDAFTCTDDWLPVVEDLAMRKFYQRLQQFQSSAAVNSNVDRQLAMLIARDKVRREILVGRPYQGRKEPLPADYWASPFIGIN